MRGLWWLVAWSCWAQILQYDHVPVPTSFRFRNTGKFFSFSPQDGQIGWFEWLGFPKRPPVVVYDRLHLDTENEAQWRGYPGLHVQLIPLNVYKEFVEPKLEQGLEGSFCCTAEDVAAGDCEEVGFVRYPANRDLNYGYKIVPGNPPERVQGAINRQAVFQTLILNCHTKTAPGYISGNVVLRGPYGYVSAVELPKILLFGITTGAYACLFLFFGFLMARHRSQVTAIHRYFLGVIFLSLVEAILSSAHYGYWNSTGYISTALMSLSLASTVLRVSCMLTLLLVLGMGWGVTTSTLPPGTKIRVRILWVALVLAETLRQYVDEIHYRDDVSDFTLVVAMIPSALLYAVATVWTLFSLGNLLGKLRRQGQNAKYSHFSRFACVLGTSGVFMLVVVVLQYFVLSLSLERRWTYEWFFTAGCEHILHFFVLSTTAVIWRPTRLSKQ